MIVSVHLTGGHCSRVQVTVRADLSLFITHGQVVDVLPTLDLIIFALQRIQVELVTTLRVTDSTVSAWEGNVKYDANNIHQI